MAAKRKTDGIVELLGRDNFSKGIRMAVENDVLDVDVYIIAEYGTDANFADETFYSVGYQVHAQSILWEDSFVAASP